MSANFYWYMNIQFINKVRHAQLKLSKPNFACVVFDMVHEKWSALKFLVCMNFNRNTV